MFCSVKVNAQLPAVIGPSKLSSRRRRDLLGLSSLQPASVFNQLKVYYNAAALLPPGCSIPLQNPPSSGMTAWPEHCAGLCIYTCGVFTNFGTTLQNISSCQFAFTQTPGTKFSVACLQNISPAMRWFFEPPPSTDFFRY